MVCIVGCQGIHHLCTLGKFNVIIGQLGYATESVFATLSTIEISAWKGKLGNFLFLMTSPPPVGNFSQMLVLFNLEGSPKSDFFYYSGLLTLTCTSTCLFVTIILWSEGCQWNRNSWSWPNCTDWLNLTTIDCTERFPELICPCRDNLILNPEYPKEHLNVMNRVIQPDRLLTYRINKQNGEGLK